MMEIEENIQNKTTHHSEEMSKTESEPQHSIHFTQISSQNNPNSFECSTPSSVDLGLSSNQISIPPPAPALSCSILLPIDPSSQENSHLIQIDQPEVNHNPTSITPLEHNHFPKEEKKIDPTLTGDILSTDLETTPILSKQAKSDTTQPENTPPVEQAQPLPKEENSDSKQPDNPQETNIDLRRSYPIDSKTSSLLNKTTLSSQLTPQKRKPPNHITVRPKFFNSRGRTRNPYRASLDKIIKVQQKQLQKFRKYASQKSWDSIHHDHYDWFMFPIEDGSQSQYNVLEDDVKELKADTVWVAGYKEAVQLVAKAWGWDVEGRKVIEEEGMGWTGWDVRLAKIIRSLWIFGFEEYKDSMQEYARKVKPTGGLSYGYICLDEVLYM
jgi:hypothetical protein